MKKSVSLSLFEGIRTAPILFRSDIENNIPLIKELGYDGVDLFVLDPSAEISRKAKQLLKDHGLGVGAIMPAALAAENLFLGDEDPVIRQRIVERMQEIIAYASEVGAMVSLGLVRGSVKGDDTVSALLERFRVSIEKLLPISQPYGVELVLEPINRYEINTINSSMEGFAFIKETGLPIGLLLDTFHMNIEDVDIHESITTCGDLVKHVHFLDSNRLAPGMGHMDMKAIYETLKTISYEGYLCLEALQGEDYRIVAQEGIHFLKSIGL
jgi:sugar phosphate isomerase/epimerase